MTKSNSADSYKIPRAMLEIVGIWPKEKPEKYYKLKTRLSWSLLIALSVTMLIELVKDLNDFIKLSKIIYFMVTILNGMIKIAVLTYNPKIVLKMLKSLKDPIFVSYPDDMDLYMKKAIKVSAFVANGHRIVSMFGALLFSVSPIIDNKPTLYPFPYDLGQYNYVLYTFQLIAGNISAWTNCSLDSLIVNLIAIAAAHLDILKAKIIWSLEAATNDEGSSEQANEKVICARLEQCVEHHCAIVKFIESIKNVFAIGLISQFLTSVLVICNTLFNFVLTPIISIQFLCLVVYSTNMILQLTMYCYFGSEIIFKSKEVAEACYFADWHLYGNRVRKYLMIIMERSKRPLGVSVMKVSTLSLTAYTSILQWSYSYLTLLLNLYQKNPTAK